MECDVAVLGGGPGGYTAAIRAAQLGAKTVCIEKEPELGGTCLRVGCIPTKAWVQTAFAIKEADETFAKLGVHVGEPQLDFATANQWKDGVVKQMTGGVAQLFKANGVEWVKGAGRFTDANTIAVEGGEDVAFRTAIVATGSFPMRPPIEGLGHPAASTRRAPRPTRASEAPRRPRRRDHRLRVRVDLRPLRLRGHDHRDAPEPHPAGGRRRGQGLAKQFGKRNIALHLEKQCTKVEDSGSALTVHFGEGETVETDLMLVSVGRAHRSRTSASRSSASSSTGGRASRPTSTAATVEHIYAVGDCAGYWQLARPSARARSPRRTRWVTRPSSTTAPSPARSTPTPRSPASGSGGPRAVRRRRRGRDVPLGRERPRRDAERDDRMGQVDPREPVRRAPRAGDGGPHVTDLIEAGVVAIDAEATVETVADGMAAHPTLSEAIKEAGLVALGRAIHLPNRKRQTAPA